MRISIGPTTNDFKLTADDGADLTGKLAVRRIAFDAGPGEAMRVWLEVYATVDISVDSDGRLRVGDPAPSWPDSVRLIEIG